jgi:D-hydroxyproline dehydrogenase subunit alpha
MIDREVLVVGAGPAGIAAATAAGESGLRVCLVDNNATTGGQIWRGGFDRGQGGQQLHRQADQDRLQRLGAAGVEIRSGDQVVALVGPQTLRVESYQGVEDIRYRSLILATGARERFLPFPGWTLPGVMGVGGLQAMVKGGLPIAGKRVVMAGTGPLLLAVADVLTRHGARLAGIFEQARLIDLLRFGVELRLHPKKIVQALGYRLTTASVAFQTDAWVIKAHGPDLLRSVSILAKRKVHRIECDYLACSFHLVPNLELPRLLGCRVEKGSVLVDAAQLTSVPRVYCAGELTGIGGLEKALVEGQIAGLAAAERPFSHLFKKRDLQMRFAGKLQDAFRPREELRALADAGTILCRCEDVSHGAVARLHSWREAKLQTRCGMGACQGRVCGPAVVELFGWEEDTIRPPLLPSRVGTLAVSSTEGSAL